MFRVATFNVENLLLAETRFAGRTDKPYTAEQYRDKISWIASILDAGRPDLIGFQELFSRKALDEVVELSRHLKPAGEVNIYAPDLEGDANFTANGEARGPFCGLVTRFELGQKEKIVDFPDDVALSVKCGDEAEAETVALPIKRFQRPVLRVEVMLPREGKEPVKAIVFVAHLKSKRSQFLPGEDKEAQKDPVLQAVAQTRSLILRAAEAVALRSLVVKATQGNRDPVFVLGDLNDDLTSVSTQIIAGDRPLRGVHPQIWDRLLYSAHELQEEHSFRDASYTHIFDGHYELLDHVFFSEEFYPRNRERLGDVKITRIFNDHLLDERLTTAIERGPSLRSDHGIPVTEIAWRSQPA